MYRDFRGANAKQQVGIDKRKRSMIFLTMVENVHVIKIEILERGVDVSSDFLNAMRMMMMMMRDAFLVSYERYPEREYCVP